MEQLTQNSKPKTLEECVQKIKDTRSFDRRNSLILLVEIFQKIRPDYYGNHEKAQKSLNALNELLKKDKRALHKFRYLISVQFKNAEILEIFADSGIEVEHSFFSEFNRRMEHKILPVQRKPESLLRTISLIFYKNSDHKWMKEIDKNTWIEFFTLLDFRADFSNPEILDKLNQSLHVLSCKVVTLSSDKEIKEHLTPEELQMFITQNRLSQKIIDFRQHYGVVSEKYRIIKEDLIRCLNTCYGIVDRVQSQSATTGTSLQQTYLLKQMNQLIYRTKIILSIANHETPLNSMKMVIFFLNLVKNENVKNSIFRLFQSNIKVLAYRIAEHEQNTGEHYITTTWKQYLAMLKSSMGGGVFAAFMAFIKTILHGISMAPFWQGFCYSINYSLGFVGIHVTGSTLATKQPAMTASAIACVMDDKKTHKPNMSELAILLSKVWRSQSASFIGNLVIAFPLALLLAILYHLISGSNMVEGEHAQVMLDWQNPLKSNCLIYACNTGVFLYLSGLVTGFVDNQVIHRDIPQRIREHPFWNRFISNKTLDRFASYTGKNMGSIFGNISLGFCLGMSSFFGYIFGIDFDIRHITISTGQFAIGLQGLEYEVAKLDLIMTIAGILLIGFLNFFISFTLAFFTASISRGVQISQYRHLVTYMRRLIARYPLDFIIPPKNGRTEADIKKHKGIRKPISEIQ